MKLWPWGSPPREHAEDPAVSDERERMKRPAGGRGVEPTLEEVDELMNGVIEQHNDRYHPGRLCREDEAGVCADLVEAWESPGTRGFRRPPSPPGWNLGTTETRLPSPTADTEEIPKIRQEEEPMTQPTAPPTEGEVVDQTPTRPPRPACPHCRGRGVVPTMNDLLRESLGLLADRGDELVRTFYTRVAQRAPHLVPLFPSDLVSAATGEEGSAGAHQRDKLLHALVDLANYYDPDDEDGMQYLNTLLAKHGRAHASFRRPDGSERGASFDEYALVKVVLFETMHDMAGEAWRPEYDTVWSAAYDHAAVEMLYAAQHWQTRVGREPRRPGEQ